MSGTSSKLLEIEEDDSLLEETYYERFVGLSEMFPEKLRNGVCGALSLSQQGVKSLVGTSRTLLWIVFSSAIIGLMPYNLEATRQEMVDAQKAQEKSILLGPNAGMTGQNMTADVPMPMLPSQQTPR